MTNSYTKLEDDHPYAGWVAMGTSPTTGRPFYVAATDSGVMKWNEAAKYATRENARIPSAEELKLICDLQNEGDLKDTFNLSTKGSVDGWGGPDSAWYWSSTPCHVANHVFAQRFSHGNQAGAAKSDVGSLRLVRD